MIPSEKEILSDLIEKVLFDEKHLNDLKRIIDLFDNNKLSTKDFGTQILIQKALNMEKLLKLISFFVDQSRNNKPTPKVIETHSDKKYRRELQEKNEFLQLVGLRVNSIANKLSKKQLI